MSNHIFNMIDYLYLCKKGFYIQRIYTPNDITNGMESPHFDGETFDSELDKDRLSRQLDIVKEAMMDGKWHTLAELKTFTGFPEASISARLRDLRKPRFGMFTIDRKRVSKGTFAYKLIAPQPLPTVPENTTFTETYGVEDYNLQVVGKADDISKAFWK